MIQDFGTHLSPPAITFSGLKKSFGSLAVLRGVDLEIAPATSCVIMGASGSGKSVLVKCLLGLIKPDAGTICVNGHDTTHLTGHAREQMLSPFGVLFQGSALFDSLTVWENVAFAKLQRKQCSRAQARDEAIAVLASVGLPERFAMAWPAELSGGMQRRVALARAIITRPSVMIFDEPTAGLDPVISSVIDGLIRASTQKLGATAITITHDIRSARRIADQVAMLHEGAIIWQGRGLESVDDPRVAQFIEGRTYGPLTASI